jgi:predicted nucleic acid-binding protein
MIVPDASVVIDLLLNRSPEVIADRVAREELLIAPYLLDVEVGQVLRRFTLARHISSQRAHSAIADYRLLPVERYPHAPFLERAFELRLNVTFYDAVYLALSEAAGVPLLTRDRALAGVPGARAVVEVL